MSKGYKQPINKSEVAKKTIAIIHSFFGKKTYKINNYNLMMLNKEALKDVYDIIRALTQKRITEFL